ncbi:MAG: J domain-containing protein, partial [Planctomycetota bacterium]
MAELLADVTSSPLHWPAGRPRTLTRNRRHWRAEVRHTVGQAMESVLGELGRMGVRRDEVVISSDRALRLDGLPRAGAREPDDPGVAVWFEFNGRPRVIACDQYRSNAQNLRAIFKTIEALRGVERWGACDLEQAFAGHQAIAPPTSIDPDPWAFYGLDEEDATADEVRAAYRAEAKLAHPDQPDGSEERLAMIVRLRDRALYEIERRDE